MKLKTLLVALALTLGIAVIAPTKAFAYCTADEAASMGSYMVNEYIVFNWDGNPATYNGVLNDAYFAGVNYMREYIGTECLSSITYWAVEMDYNRVFHAYGDEAYVAYLAAIYFNVREN